MGGAISHNKADQDIIDACVSIRPDLKGLAKEELFKRVKADLLLAQEARETMPKGFSLEEYDSNEQSTSVGGKISKVGHITRVVKDAEISVKFYCNLVGAKVLNRPKFATNGYWLWLGNVQLHLIESDLACAPDHPDAGSRVNHISFDCYDFDECEQRVKAAGIEYKKVYVPEGDRGINQIFFQDPDGHWIELCDCNKMNDFIFGEYDEARADEIRKFYLEGVEPKGSFVASLMFMLLCQDGKSSENSPLHDLFNQYSDGDGHICENDLIRVMKRFGGNVSDENIRAFVKNHDTDGSDTLDFAEFAKFLSDEVLNAQGDSVADEAFAVVDRNSSNSVTKDEFLHCCELLSLELSDEQKNKVFEVLDLDGNAAINKEEFRTLFDQLKAVVANAPVS